MSNKWKETLTQKISTQAKIGKGFETTTVLFIQQLARKLSQRGISGFDDIDKAISIQLETTPITNIFMRSVREKFYDTCDANDIEIDLELED